MLYLSVKAAHLIFVVAWMAAMLIYPRYKIHQLASQPGEPLFETMSAAANRLRHTILTPAITLAWVLGVTMLVLNPDLLSAGWLQTKLVLALVMSGLHGYFVGIGKKIDAGTATTVPTALRVLNEIPFLLLIAIVILVIIRPF